MAQLERRHATRAEAPRLGRAIGLIAQRRAEELLAEAGVQVNGSRPWDIHVHDDRLYARVMAHGSLGFGESYMDGWWDCPAIDQLFDRLLRVDMGRRVNPLIALATRADSRLHNRQHVRESFEVGRRHYDIGNDLYEVMLDRRMIYSCAYWATADTLDAAQEAKLDLICRKLGLEPGMHVLDIGCGWGGLAQFMAERYGVSVVGVTISAEQAALAAERCKGLPIEIRLEDYRSTQGSFDRVVSVGMFEHVGSRNYRTFMRTARRLLRPDGLLLLHTIGTTRAFSGRDAWVDRYIFPNSELPAASQIARAAEGLFVCEDLHNFGAYYDRTLMAWEANFEQAWPELRDSYGERFYRMWRYYLLCCAGSFRARSNQLFQVVLAPRGVPGGYASLR